MNKQLLFQYLIQGQEETIRDLREKIASSNGMVDVDETDTIDPEDLSHQTEAGEMKHLFEKQLFRKEVELEQLKNMNIEQKMLVEAGAYVSTEKFHFFVGHATMPFDFEGKHIVGISVDSPIFPKMKGKYKGDSFSHAGNDYTILDIS
jgi:hypothetical protein